MIDKSFIMIKNQIRGKINVKRSGKMIEARTASATIRYPLREVDNENEAAILAREIESAIQLAEREV